MRRQWFVVPWIILVTPVGFAGTKRTAQPLGVVVESVDKGYAADRAGIRPGDVLLSWTRAANPPANPTGASGDFRSPFDVEEIEIDQVPRGRLTLLVLRPNQRLSLRISAARWHLQTRPRFSERWRTAYLEAKRVLESRDIQKGSELFRSLATELSRSGDRMSSAWVWLKLGIALSDEERPDQALIALDQALLQAQTARQTDVEAQVWCRKSDALCAAHQGEQARAAARQAISIRGKIQPRSLAVADSMATLGDCMAWLSPELDTIDRTILTIREEQAPGSIPVAASLNNLGNIAAEHGDLRRSVELLVRALSIFQNIAPISPETATILQNLCATETDRGDLATADEYCRRSIDVRRQLGLNDLGLAASLHNTGNVAETRGDVDRAEQLHLEALHIRERLAPVSTDIAWSLYQLGLIELDRRNLDAAEDYFQRAERIQEVLTKAPSAHAADIAKCRAEIAYLRRDWIGSEAYLKKCLDFYEKLAPNSPHTASALDYLGRVLDVQGRTLEAEQNFRRALSLQEQFAPLSQGTAKSRHSLGLLLWKTHQLTEAEQQLRGALDDLEAQRTRIGGSEESKSVFASQFADYYRDYADLLMELHREQDALFTLERFRAASMLRMMAQRDLDFSNEVPTEIDRERMSTNADYDRAQTEIRVLNPKEDEARVQELLGRLTELRTKQEEIADRIKRISPRYASLQYPQPLDLFGMRSAIDRGTLLLAYSFGRDRSFLFAVEPLGGSTGLSVFTIPFGEEALRGEVDAFRDLVLGRLSADLVSRERSLYDSLIKPAEPLIARYDRILILPDGPLHTLPFSALVRSVKNAKPEYLVEWKPIHTAVSVTVYAELKKARKGTPRDPSVVVAAFGDPKYPKLPETKVAVTRGDGEEPDPLVEDDGIEDPQLRSVARGGFRFEPLPESRKEVEAIASLYAPKAAAYLGSDATEERAKSIGKHVPLIHYACHAVINERFPLDSALVFTIPEKPKERQDNGLLQAWEIFERVRIDADLVTLSACESGLGKEMGGEGLIGLTRAFQYAGARSVLASLWKVDDKATAELMKRFYGYLKAGKTKDEALRLAQIDLIHSTDYSHPRDWAAFQLNGDWK